MKYQKEDITKSFYENISYNFLKRNETAAIIINGENYNEYSKKFQKPYDNIFISSMNKALVHMCSQIPTCLFGYTSCFDMAIFFSPPETFEQTSWFNYDTNRIATYASSVVTFEYNRFFEKTAKSYVMSGKNFDETRKFTAMQGYVSAIDAGAFFTAKCFNIKKDQISDYVYLLQKQTINGAVHEMGLMYFKEEELIGKTASEIQLMVFEKAKTNFDNYPASFKHGSFCVKNFEQDGELIVPGSKENSWVIDKASPLLKPGTKTYLEKILG
jgi:tRNA(His) guanylyltransferase